MRESQKTMENGNYIQNYIHIYIQKEAVFHFQERSIAVLCMFGLYFFVLFSDRLLAAENWLSTPGSSKKKHKLEVSEFNKIQTISLFLFLFFYYIVLLWKNHSQMNLENSISFL